MIVTRLIGALALLTTPTFARLERRQPQSVDAYIASEGPISKAGLLANIGPSGAKANGAKSGVVIASPSTFDPNYLYTWIRDSSLVYKVLIDQFTEGVDSSLQAGIDAWVASQARIQQVSNPSGTVASGGLGEPKFNIDESAFTDPWGRPQRDGPALRAISMITYANWLLQNGGSSTVQNTLWPAIKLDLDYVAAVWNQPGFDLWEEVNGDSFFTTAMQHRSLRQGAALAQALGDSERAGIYSTQGGNTLCFLQNYWDGSNNYVLSNKNVQNYGRSGIDVNAVLASIHSFDPAAACEAATFQPCSDKALATHYAVVNSFRDIYGINSGIPIGRGVAVGRYKEDVYYNGNPWYLATFAAAEQLYDALYTWDKIGQIPVTGISVPFFKQFLQAAGAGSYAKGSAEYNTIVAGVKQMADDFVLINAKYTPANGALAEQFKRDNGTPLSAADLTWSYASAITAFGARASQMPTSWGAAGLTAPNAPCGAPATPPGTVPITFKVNYNTQYGENLYVVGSLDHLGAWNADHAIAMGAQNYPTWSATVNLPASTAFTYKYIRKYNGQVYWESDPNNSFTTPASGSYTLNDSWH